MEWAADRPRAQSGRDSSGCDRPCRNGGALCGFIAIEPLAADGGDAVLHVRALCDVRRRDAGSEDRSPGLGG